VQGVRDEIEAPAGRLLRILLLRFSPVSSEAIRRWL